MVLRDNKDLKLGFCKLPASTDCITSKRFLQFYDNSKTANYDMVLRDKFSVFVDCFLVI